MVANTRNKKIFTVLLMLFLSTFTNVASAQVEPPPPVVAPIDDFIYPAIVVAMIIAMAYIHRKGKKVTA